MQAVGESPGRKPPRLLAPTHDGSKRSTSSQRDDAMVAGETTAVAASSALAVLTGRSHRRCWGG